MKYKAILSQTTRDYIKSRILAEGLSQVVLDVYMTSEEFAKLVSTFMGEEFEVTFNKDGQK